MHVEAVAARPRWRRAAGAGVGAVRGPLRWFWDFSRKKPLGGVGFVLLFVLTVVAIFGPWLTPQDALQIHATQLFLAPEWTHGFYLGTDHFGRDTLSRLIIGTRVSLTVAVVSVFTGSAIGYLIGLISGYYRGWVDAVLQRMVDILMSLPMLVLALVIVAVLGQSQRNVIIALALIQVPSMARLVKSVVLPVREMEFVQAAHALGASDSRILIRHIAPQTFGPVIVLVTASLGLAILIESSLSFLGLGTPPPKPAWGAMLSGQTLQNVERAPWNAVFPGIAISLTVFSFNLLGDALRDVLDPRLRV